MAAKKQSGRGKFASWTLEPIALKYLGYRCRGAPESAVFQKCGKSVGLAARDWAKEKRPAVTRCHDGPYLSWGTRI